MNKTKTVQIESVVITDPKTGKKVRASKAEGTGAVEALLADFMKTAPSMEEAERIVDQVYGGRKVTF